MRDYASGSTYHHRVSEEWPPRLTASRYRQPEGCYSAPVYRATELPVPVPVPGPVHRYRYRTGTVPEPVPKDCLHQPTSPLLVAHLFSDCCECACTVPAFKKAYQHLNAQIFL